MWLSFFRTCSKKRYINQKQKAKTIPRYKQVENLNESSPLKTVEKQLFLILDYSSSSEYTVSNATSRRYNTKIRASTALEPKLT